MLTPVQHRVVSQGMGSDFFSHLCIVRCVFPGRDAIALFEVSCIHTYSSSHAYGIALAHTGPFLQISLFAHHALAHVGVHCAYLFHMCVYVCVCMCVWSDTLSLSYGTDCG
ncbi:hypothetical protein VOLCADRAFT_104432 [Volvox carteri f. nagariensis]|uniref:Uncharacterized protein n=1 Tax=Volvox carteri f. nagariensis TaxID=3068 RepID=D8TTL0_VOLCA|nr:uncharacterized protein VOLCADRAFT_104432 [Volvox carteri f. nagariensis]EFJ49325.1 hypothetical protein VOLCADRAFT_104432 [Volvox carteri f. nagariensis]|eukprot:XP_002949773.1 hypothetical protein VOLCADRAFT_104432 [Volvox carteri f. nagariensis]